MRSILSYSLSGFGILLFSPISFAQDCDRHCLQTTLTIYLDALLKDDPDLAPLADNVRFVEDLVELSPGEGLWNSIAGYGTFRQDVLDVQQGIAGTHVVAMEDGEPRLLALRLKVEDRLITEIESTVVRTREEGMIFQPQAVIAASQAMNTAIPEGQRNSREEMIDIALRYPEGLRIGSFVAADAPFAADAYRIENGQLMAGPGCTFFPDCENIREQSIPTLAGIQAEVAAVDETLGIVWLRMNFGPGSVMRAEGELSVWEMFKIYDDRIQAVEAYMEVVSEGAGLGW